MPSANLGADLSRTALIIVDMQNDFLHPDGSFAHIAREHPDANIDLPFLTGTIPQVKRLADAVRAAGRPVVYVAHVLKRDYSDAAFPYWRMGIDPGSGSRTHCVEGTWGARVVDELKPQDGEHLVVKKGFGGFSNTPLDNVLRSKGIDTCIVSGVTTCVCISSTVRGGVAQNYRMIIAKDGVAEVNKHTHTAELETMQRLFGDVVTVDEMVTWLSCNGR
jgi:ureidoacrylate peracid hydrolase